MDRIKSFWLEQGVQHESDSQERKRIYLSNLISLILIFSLLPYIPIDLYFRWLSMALVNAISLLCLLTVPWLNYKGRTQESRWLLIILCYTELFFLSLSAGTGSGIHLSAFIVGCLPLILFGARPFWKWLLGSVIALLVYWVLYLFPVPSKLPESILPMVHLLFTFTIFSALFLIVYYLVKVNEDNEKGLIQAHQTQSQFFAQMSHELRTPLTAIIGYSEMMEEDIEGGEFEIESILSDIQRVHSSAGHLKALINDLLDLSKIKSGEMKLLLEPIQLQDLCTEIEMTLIPLLQAQENKLVLEVEPNVPPFCGDQAKLRQCLLNLMSNAAKFTKKGTITFRALLEPSKGKNQHSSRWLCFSVEDTGEGMTKEETMIISKPYKQLKRTQSKYQGTGLGLPITYDLCSLMGGTLFIESEVGKGTVCTIRIPVTFSIEC